jgi:hypothetical protein
MGRTRFSASASPPIMIDSVALIAADFPSAHRAIEHRAAMRGHLAASLRVTTGEMLLMSITTEPRCNAVRTPLAR